MYRVGRWIYKSIVTPVKFKTAVGYVNRRRGAGPRFLNGLTATASRFEDRSREPKVEAKLEVSGTIIGKLGPAN